MSVSNIRRVNDIKYSFYKFSTIIAMVYLQIHGKFYVKIQTS